jgi:preprotein translocase subunit SecG
MTIVLILIVALIILTAVLMIFAVMIQNSKGGGISSAFGASVATQALGGRRSNELIEKITWGLAIAMLVFALGSHLALGLSSGSDGESGLRMGSAIDNQIIDAPISVPSQETFQGPTTQEAPQE